MKWTLPPIGMPALVADVFCRSPARYELAYESTSATCLDDLGERLARVRS